MPEKKTLKGADLKALVASIIGASLAEQIQAEVAKAMEAQAGTMRTTFYAEAFARGGGGAAHQQQAQEKGILAAQYIRCMGASYLSKSGGGSYRSALDIAKAEYGAEAAVTRVLSATDFSSGGALVPREVAAEIIELLRPASVVRRMNPVIMGMDSGTMTIPKLTGGATATYTQENANIAVTGQTFGDVQLIARKLACIVVLSNDWLRRAVSGADAMVRDDTVAAIAQRSDLAFIRGDGTQNTPRGLRYLAPTANVIPSTVTPTLATITTDMGNLWLALRDDETRMLRPGWLWAPRVTNTLMTIRDGNGNYAFRDELLTGKFWGWPYADTTQIPVNLSLVAGGGDADHTEVYLTDFADFVIGETTQLILDLSGEAAYHDGSAVQAAFSKDQSVMRAIVEHDSGLRHDGSAAVLYDVEF